MGCCAATPKAKVIHPRPLHEEKGVTVRSAEDMKFSAASVVFHKATPISDDYGIGAKLGEGTFGVVRRVIHQASGQHRAAKSIRKSLLTDDMKTAGSTTEIDILRQLDHPNILKLYEFYEDKHCFYMVTELITGGELFDFVVKHKMLTESIAAHFIKQVLAALSYCHSAGVVHRDLKPENLVLEVESAEAALKLIDFGTATVLKDGRALSELTGSPYYIAPEVLRGSYNHKCDVWSCGVILYILLSGRPPFKGRNDKEIFSQIRSSRVAMNESYWRRVSNEAKDLIGKMLERDPAKRPEAQELLSHPWFQTVSSSPTIGDESILETLENLKKFHAESKLQEAVVAFISHQLVSNDDTKELNAAFRTIDKNGDGKLSKEELIEGYSSKMDPFEAVEQVERIMQEVDTDANGYIEYTEFIAASLQKDRLLSIDNLEATFSAFDIDGSGTISATELRTLLGDRMTATDSVWADLIKQVDQNGDGEIDLKEFKEMMLKLL